MCIDTTGKLGRLQQMVSYAPASALRSEVSQWDKPEENLKFQQVMVETRQTERGGGGKNESEGGREVKMRVRERKGKLT